MSRTADDDGRHSEIPERSHLAGEAESGSLDNEAETTEIRDEQSIQTIDRLLRHVYKKGAAEIGNGQEQKVDEYSWIERLLIAELPERFEVNGRLGSGTFGVVFRALDQRLGRVVALKILRPEWLHSETHLARFLRESRVASRLNHTHIVRVLETGESEKIAWQVLDIVDGDSLDEHIRLGKIDYVSAVRIVSQLADALDYAHQQGVIHRDIKPANILLNRRVGDDLTDAIALLTDFGLARVTLDQNTKPATSIGVVGTPQYMAPEMIEQGVSASGPQSDIYSLGVVLYECLCGQNPLTNNRNLLDRFRHLNMMQKAIPADFPGLPKDLVAICKKSVATSLLDRYITAKSLAEDLRCVLHGLPVSARTVSLPERTWRVAKQNKILTLLTCALIGCLTMLVLISFRSFQSASIQNRLLTEANRRLSDQQLKSRQLTLDAERLRDQAMTERTRFAALSRDSSIVNAYKCYEDERIEESLGVLDSLKKNQPQAARSFDWRLLHSQISSEYRRISSFDGPVTEVCRIPNSQLVAVVSGSQVELIDSQTGEMKSRIQANITNIHAIAVHPYNPHLFLGGSTDVDTDQAQLIQLDWTTGQTVEVLDSFPTTIESIRASEDGRVLMAASRYEPPRIYDLTNDQKWLLPGNYRKNSWLGLMNSKNLAVYHQGPESIGIASTIDRSLTSSLDFAQTLGNGFITTATVVGDGPMIAVASQIGVVYLLNVEDGSIVGTLTGCKNISVLSSNPSGRLVAAGTAGGEIGVWQIPVEAAISPHRDAIAKHTDLTDRKVTSTGVKSSFGNLEKFRSWQLKSTFVNSLAFVEGRLLCGTDSGELVSFVAESGLNLEPDRQSIGNESTIVWETAACRENGNLFLRNRSGSVYSIATSQLADDSHSDLSETSNQATSKMTSGTIDLTPYLSRNNLLDSAPPVDTIAGIAVSTNGGQVAWPHDSLQFKFLHGSKSNLLSRRSNATTESQNLRVLSLSPDASMVAVATEKYWLCILSTMSDDHQVARFELPGKPYCVQWTHDQRQLFVAGNFDSIVQCDVETGVVSKVASVHTSSSVLFLTADQKTIISGHTDGSLRVTSLVTRISQSMLVHDSQIGSIALDRDEELGLSADVEGNVVAWNLRNQQRLGTIWKAMPQNRSALQVSPSLLLTQNEDQLWVVTHSLRGPVARWLVLE